MSQELFNPLDYGFRWVGDWYEYDGKIAERAALKARNVRVRELRSRGLTVRCSTLRSQLVTQGGIGSGHPQIELVVPVYCVTYDTTQADACYDRYARGGI